MNRTPIDKPTPGGLLSDERQKRRLLFSPPSSFHPLARTRWRRDEGRKLALLARSARRRHLPRDRHSSPFQRYRERPLEDETPRQRLLLAGRVGGSPVRYLVRRR